jgi:hypothetical protein
MGIVTYMAAIRISSDRNTVAVSASTSVLQQVDSRSLLDIPLFGRINVELETTRLHTGNTVPDVSFVIDSPQRWVNRLQVCKDPTHLATTFGTEPATKRKFASHSDPQLTFWRPSFSAI